MSKHRRFVVREKREGGHYWAGYADWVPNPEDALKFYSRGTAYESVVLDYLGLPVPLFEVVAYDDRRLLR